GGAGLAEAGGGGVQEYRWRHTEAVKLLERALAVHRETLGDDHPVTEESLQALAAAGGSSSPVSPRSTNSSGPISISRDASTAPSTSTVRFSGSAPILAAAAAAVAATASAITASTTAAAAAAAAASSRPTSVDPPPPSLDCLNGSDHAREHARELQRQQQREHEQRVKWEHAQAQKLAREIELEKQRLEEEKRVKVARELIRQQNLEKQALAREEAEMMARAAKLREDKEEAVLAQRQQRQLQIAQRNQRRLAASTEPIPRDNSAPAPGVAAGNNTPVLVRYHTTDATGIEPVAAAASSGQGGNPSSAPVSRTRSAESLGARRGTPARARDIVTRNFGFGGSDDVPSDGGTGDSAGGDAKPPEGCRLA
ncbi:unnamed protein product, partial [Scytosiphon promiscuus]